MRSLIAVVGLGFGTLFVTTHVVLASSWQAGQSAELKRLDPPRVEAAFHAEPRIVPNQANPRVFPPGSMPYGASFPEWTARWWKWVLGIPAASNPLLDSSGEFCSQGQSGPVWFLAGTVGGPASRSCSIPAGRAIFFPIVNVEIDAPCPFPECAAALTAEDCAADPAGCEACLAGAAADFANSVTALDVELDGNALGSLFDHRSASGLFTTTANVSLQAFDTCITGELQPFASDGYWVMLAPLRPGEHTLHFHALGEFFGFPFEVDVSYDLDVLPGRSGRGQIAGEAGGVQNATWGLMKKLYR
jgi:hypothetical protein